MDFIVNKVIEKVSEKRLNRTKYKVTRLKTISGIIHAIMVDLEDENSEIMVAMSVLEDKDKNCARDVTGVRGGPLLCEHGAISFHSYSRAGFTK